MGRKNTTTHKVHRYGGVRLVGKVKHLLILKIKHPELRINKSCSMFLASIIKDHLNKYNHGHLITQFGTDLTNKTVHNLSISDISYWDQHFEAKGGDVLKGLFEQTKDNYYKMLDLYPKNMMESCGILIIEEQLTNIIEKYKKDADGILIHEDYITFGFRDRIEF